MQHSLIHRRYLPVAFGTIAKCFPAWKEGALGIQRMIDGNPAQSLQTPVEILSWTAIYASWKVQCAVKHNPESRHTFSLFRRRWVSVFTSLSQANCYVFISVDQVRIFISAIESLQTGALTHPSLSITPPPKPQGHMAVKAEHKQQRK